MAYSEQIQLLFSKYLHHGWRKFWISMLWNGLEEQIQLLFSQSMFTMVEENFEFQCFEMA